MMINQDRRFARASMTTNSMFCRIAMTAFVALSLGRGAYGQFQIDLIEATAEAEYEWQPADTPITGSQSEAIELPEFSAFAEVDNIGFGPPFGRAAAYQDVYGINAVFADAGNALDDALRFYSRAETNYEIEVTTPTSESGEVAFEFVINGGELRLENFAAIDELGGNSSARVRAEIFVGAQFWVLDLTLRKFFGDPDIFDASIESFGTGFPTFTPVVDGDDVVVTIPRIEGETLFELSRFRVGLNFSYTMTAELELNGLSLGGLAGIGDPFSLSMGGPSTAGVEFFLDGMPLTGLPIVPEPSAAALAIVALSLFAAALRNANASRRTAPPNEAIGATQ